MRATRLILIVAVVVAVTLPLAAYNLPSITSIAPSAVPAGSGSFTLTVSGSYFNGRDKITWNGVRLTTTLVSLTQAQAVVPANYVASAGNANVALWDSRSGTFSTAVTFTITAGTPVGVSIAPGSSALSPGSPQQFTAAVSGTTNTAVTWSASGGTISSTGLYTAPSAVSTARVLPDAVGPSPAGASVGHGSTVSWLHTASGSNRLVTVGCSLGKLDIPPFTLSATYGGISMLSDPVSLKKVNGTGDGAVQMFYLAAPPTGQQTVMVTLSGTTADLECGSVSFTGVDQLTPLRHTATSTGYSSTPCDYDQQRYRGHGRKRDRLWMLGWQLGTDAGMDEANQLFYWRQQRSSIDSRWCSFGGDELPDCQRPVGHGGCGHRCGSKRQHLRCGT